MQRVDREKLRLRPVHPAELDPWVLAHEHFGGVCSESATYLNTVLNLVLGRGLDVGEEGLDIAHVETEVGLEGEAEVAGEVELGLKGLVEGLLGGLDFLHLGGSGGVLGLGGQFGQEVGEGLGHRLRHVLCARDLLGG